MKEESGGTAQKPWTCPKCLEKVFVSRDIHAFLCIQYQRKAKKKGGRAA